MPLNPKNKFLLIHSRPKTAVSFRSRICSGRSVFRPQEPRALARVGSILVMVSFLTGFIFIRLSKAENDAETGHASTQKASGTTRIIISTSGPAKFDSRWLDNPNRLIVEFRSGNVVANLENEMVVDQGVIKKITSSYFEGRGANTLKTLAFELTEKVPYKIWQEGNAILLDIQSPLETPGLRVDNKGIFKGDQANYVLNKKLEVIDSAFKQILDTQNLSEISSLEISNAGTVNELKGQIGGSKAEDALSENTAPKNAPLSVDGHSRPKNNMLTTILWFTGLVSILGLGFTFWRKYVVIRTKNLAEWIKKLKVQLVEKDKLLEQVEIIRKAIEETAIEKEKEYGQLKLELDEKSKLFEQEATIRTEKEKALQELEKAHTQLKETSESLKDVLVKRGIAKELTLPEEKGELWVSGKSSERRNTPRLILTKDFNNTVIVKVELPGIAKQIKSFAENISSGGLCFETAKELDDREAVSLRLFFYGGKVPNFRTQGWIVWKKTHDSKNCYGLTFEGLSEKVKSELEHYIESNISEDMTYGTRSAT